MLEGLYAVVRLGRRRTLAWVTALAVLQSVMQMLGVFSVLPFLSAATNPDGFRRARLGQAFVRTVHAETDGRLLLCAGAVSLAMLVLANGVTIAAEYARSRYAHGLEQKLRTGLVAGLLARPYQYFTTVNSAALLKTLLEDTSAVASRLVLPAIDVFARTLLALLLVAGLLVLDPWLVLGGGAVLGIFFMAAMNSLQRRAQRSSEKVKSDIPRLYRELLQLLNGAKPIIATGSAAHFVGRAERASRAVLDEIPRIRLYAMLPRASLEIVVSGGLILWVLVALAGGGSLAGLVPRLGLVAVVAYRLTPSLQAIFTQVAAMHASRHSLDEVLALMREAPASSAPGGDARPAAPLQWSSEIRFDDVSFAYAGAGAPAVQNVSFTIRKGERVAFVGPTGAGKSTLIDLLLGLLEPTSGRILVDGVPLTCEVMPGWRRAIGYVPQDLYLVDGTVDENIAFGRNADELDDGQLRKAVDSAQARGFVHRLRLRGIDAVGERGVRLSGGECQRLGIARALYGSPSILVLDEGTSALDLETERLVLETIGRDQRLTVITVTHRTGSLSHYDARHHVAQGRIVLSEPATASELPLAG